MCRFLFLIAAFLLATSPTLFSQQLVERMEPPNWWVGMVSENLEIMVYGKNIGGAGPHPPCPSTPAPQHPNPRALAARALSTLARGGR